MNEDVYFKYSFWLISKVNKTTKIPLKHTSNKYIRVDHISKSVSNVDSKLFIPFQYIRIYTKKIFSHIGTDLGVPQGGSNFTKGLIRANMSKTRKWPYLAWFSSKLKNKTTFFSSTLKVWQNKVVLFFHFKPKWARYGHFLVLKFLI